MMGHPRSNDAMRDRYSAAAERELQREKRQPLLEYLGASVFVIFLFLSLSTCMPPAPQTPVTESPAE